MNNYWENDFFENSFVPCTNIGAINIDLLDQENNFLSLLKNFLEEHFKIAVKENVFICANKNVGIDGYLLVYLFSISDLEGNLLSYFRTLFPLYKRIEKEEINDEVSRAIIICRKNLVTHLLTSTDEPNCLCISIETLKKKYLK